jgi:hypothetical protein
VLKLRSSIVETIVELFKIAKLNHIVRAFVYREYDPSLHFLCKMLRGILMESSALFSIIDFMKV